MATLLGSALAVGQENYRLDLHQRQSACFQPPFSSAKNPWASYALHPNKFGHERIQTAVEKITDTYLKQIAQQAVAVGSFLWM